MANISELLNIIANAVYGRDMREAIHDAIETVNDDAENSIKSSGGTMTGNLNMGSNKITSSAAPETAYDLTNKNYVDNHIAGKVDKIAGMGLSSNDFTDTYKDVLNLLSRSAFNIRFEGENFVLLDTDATPIWLLTSEGIFEYQNNGNGHIIHHLSEKANISDIVNNVITDDESKMLSAKMGMELNQRIQNLASIGRYLALWDCIEGLPTTAPPSTHYPYLAGDYFIVSNARPNIDDVPAFRTDRGYEVGEMVGYDDHTTSNARVYKCIVRVAIPGEWNASNWELVKNYKPDSSQYTTTKSTTEEPLEVYIGDIYRYDGTTWSYLGNTSKFVTFHNISGSPYDNLELQMALDDKVGFTNYAGINGGVVKANPSKGFRVINGNPESPVVEYEQYDFIDNDFFISKGTLENVIVGKHLDRPQVKSSIESASGLNLNTIYNLGEQSRIVLDLLNSAQGAQIGDFVQIDFLSGDTPTTLEVGAYAIVADFDFTPESNKGYSLYFDYGLLSTDNSYTPPIPIYGWRFGYNEWTYTVGE